MDMPLITYLVSSGPQAVSEEIDLFHIPEPLARRRTAGYWLADTDDKWRLSPHKMHNA
jgi:hypothetical protein